MLFVFQYIVFCLRFFGGIVCNISFIILGIFALQETDMLMVGCWVYFPSSIRVKDVTNNEHVISLYLLNICH